MPTETLLASALLGTARRPLAPADEARARRLSDARAAPQRALALAAAESLAARAALPTERLPADAELAAPPPQPGYGALDEHLGAYLLATRQLAGRPDTRYLADRGILAPPHLLTFLLEHTVGGRGAVDCSAVLALGPRGLWLARHHPRFRGRLAFLDRAAPPSVAWQRLPYHAHRLRVRATADGPGETALATNDPLLAEAIARGILAPALGLHAAVELMRGERRPRPSEADVLARLLAMDGWSERVRELRRAIAPPPASGQMTLSAFRDSAAAARGLGDAALADRLLRYAVAGEDELTRRHPALPGLVRTLDANRFAAFVDFAAPHYPRGWRDTFLLALVDASDYPLSANATEQFLLDAARGRAGIVQSLASRYPHRLHTAAVPTAVALAHDHPHSTDAADLLGILLARQRLDESFPLNGGQVSSPSVTRQTGPTKERQAPRRSRKTSS